MHQPPVSTRTKPLRISIVGRFWRFERAFLIMWVLGITIIASWNAIGWVRGQDPPTGVLILILAFAGFGIPTCLWRLRQLRGLEILSRTPRGHILECSPAGVSIPALLTNGWLLRRLLRDNLPAVAVDWRCIREWEVRPDDDGPDHYVIRLRSPIDHGSRQDIVLDRQPLIEAERELLDYLQAEAGVPVLRERSAVPSP